MAEKVIALACAAGMSTSLLVTKMQQAAKEAGKDYEIFAKSVAEIDNMLAGSGALIRSSSFLYESRSY